MVALEALVVCIGRGKSIQLNGNDNARSTDVITLQWYMFLHIITGYDTHSITWYGISHLVNL